MRKKPCRFTDLIQLRLTHDAAQGRLGNQGRGFQIILHLDDGRHRIHLQVVAEVRRPIGRDRAIFVRLGACDEMTGGLTLDEGCATAARLADAGVDLISVSGGLQGSELTGRGPGYFVPYAAAIKSFVSIPIMVTGGIADPVLADRIVRNGQADLIGIGRAMLNDAAWARKAIEVLHAR